MNPPPNTPPRPTRDSLCIHLFLQATSLIILSPHRISNDRDERDFEGRERKEEGTAKKDRSSIFSPGVRDEGHDQGDDLRDVEMRGRIVRLWSPWPLASTQGWVSRRRRRMSTAESVDLTTIPRPSRRQLWSLAIGNAVPFIGFGFADNLIMILAGDAIDKTLGMAFGISTLAAAGLGNMLSDIVGIGVGDVIERYSSAILGKRAVAALTLEQMELSVCRMVKTWASVVGISIGCLLGMVPLFFIGNRKPLYFTPEEMMLYESSLRPYGVSPQHFFDLMRRAEWRTYDAGTTVLKAGQKLDRVLLVASGAVDSYETTRDGGLRRLYRYRAKRDINDPLRDTATSSSSNDNKDADTAKEPPDTGLTLPIDTTAPPIRGCVIGGTALLDESVRRYPYPSTVIAAEHTRVVEWQYSTLRKEMDEDKAIEAAICAILYFDLVEGLRRQRGGKREGSTAKHTASTPLAGDEHVDGVPNVNRLDTYEAILHVALSDGVVHAAEREFLANFALQHHITEEEHQVTPFLVLSDRNIGRPREDGMDASAVQLRCQGRPGRWLSLH